MTIILSPTVHEQSKNHPPELSFEWQLQNLVFISHFLRHLRYKVNYWALRINNKAFERGMRPPIWGSSLWRTFKDIFIFILEMECRHANVKAQETINHLASFFCQVERRFRSQRSNRQPLHFTLFLGVQEYHKLTTHLETIHGDL